MPIRNYPEHAITQSSCPASRRGLVTFIREIDCEKSRVCISLCVLTKKYKLIRTGVTMKSKEEILNALSDLTTELRKSYKVERIGLFGSFARQEQQPGSDIDLLVDFSDDADLFDVAELKYFLEEKLHNAVDIVPARALRDELRHAVLADVSYV